jgi:putative peptidoglycan lipid II flippase
MSNSGLLRSSSVMAAGTVMSRVLGFVRTAMLTSLLGVTASAAADTFATANTVPNNINSLLILGLLNAVLVPQIIRANQDEDGGQAFLDRLLTVSLVGMLAITVLALLAAPLVPKIFAGGQTWDGPTQALCVAFALWCLPQIFFYGLYATLGQILNARGQFGAYMWSPLVNNVVAIAGLAIMLHWIGPFNRATGATHAALSWSDGQIALLAGTATLGVAGQAIILIIPLWRSGFRYTPRFDWRSVGLGSIGRIALWTFAATALGQLGFVAVIRAVNSASAAGGPGQLAYTNGFALFILPHSIVTVSLVTALFTRMSQSAQTGDLAAVRSDLSLGIRLTAVPAVLAVAGMAAIGPDLTATLFVGTSRADTLVIAQVALALMIGLVPYSIQHLAQRTYYSLGRAQTTFIIQLPVAATVATFSFLSLHLLDPSQVVIGVAAGLSVSYAVGATLSLADLGRRLGGIDGRNLAGHYVRLGLAAAPAILAGRLSASVVHALMSDSATSHLVSLIIGGSAVTVIYGMFCWWLGVPQAVTVAATLRRRLSRTS